MFPLQDKENTVNLSILPDEAFVDELPGSVPWAHTKAQPAEERP